jgi:hypothetical protein
MAKPWVTFQLPAAAYDIIRQEAMSPGKVSTLPQESREALTAAASLPEGVWVVDCAEAVSLDIEDWFQQAAAVESATPKGDEDRFKILTDAVRTIRDGRQKSRREHRTR